MVDLCCGECCVDGGCEFVVCGDGVYDCVDCLLVLVFFLVFVYVVCY